MNDRLLRALVRSIDNLSDTVDEMFKALNRRLDTISRAVGVEPNPKDRRKRCPVCDMPYARGTHGWKAHIGSLAACPKWKPDVTDPEERKRLFELKHFDWFRRSGSKSGSSAAS